MSLTESEIQTALTAYIAARQAILNGGQSYTINTGGSTRTVTMADLGEIERQIIEYNDMLDELNEEKGFQIGAGW